MDRTPFLRRMAELQEDSPEISDREAARLVKEENPERGLSPETLRTEYRSQKVDLRADVRRSRYRAPGSAFDPARAMAAAVSEQLQRMQERYIAAMNAPYERVIAAQKAEVDRVLARISESAQRGLGLILGIKLR